MTTEHTNAAPTPAPHHAAAFKDELTKRDYRQNPRLTAERVAYWRQALGLADVALSATPPAEETPDALLRWQIALLEAATTATGEAEMHPQDWSWLAYTPSGDPNFKGALPRANLATVQYAIAVALAGPSNKGRMSTLRRRLAVLSGTAPARNPKAAA